MGFSRSPGRYYRMQLCRRCSSGENLWPLLVCASSSQSGLLHIIYQLFFFCWLICGLATADARTHVARPIINTVACTVGDFIHCVKVSARCVLRSAIIAVQSMHGRRRSAIVFRRGPAQNGGPFLDGRLS